MREPGRVMLLQGVSSSGKTTLGRALQRSLEEYWWLLDADMISEMQPTAYFVPIPFHPTREERPHRSWDPDAVLDGWLDGYFGAATAIARSGSNVIMVGGWLKVEWLLRMADALDGLSSLIVGVYCSEAEAERRESARGDRATGYSRSQWESVHLFTPYDVVVDTSKESMEVCVEKIRQALNSPPAEPYFARARTALGV